MAQADEQRFLITLSDTKDALNSLGMLATTTDIQKARVKLHALVVDAATYLTGRKRDAIVNQAMQGLSLWDFLEERGDSLATRTRRVLRYLTTIQTILSLPEAEVPSPTPEEQKNVNAAVASVEKGVIKKQEGFVDTIKGASTGMKIAGGIGLIALIAALAKKFGKRK